MNTKVFQTTIILFFIASNIAYCALNYIPLKVDAFTVTSYGNVIHDGNLNTDPYFSGITLQSIGISFWFKPQSFQTAPLLKVIYTCGSTIQISTLSFGIFAQIVYSSITENWSMNNKWIGCFAQENYSLWKRNFFCLGQTINKISGYTYDITSDSLIRIIQDIYLGGNESNFCSSCSLANIYLILNNYFDTTDYAYSILGGDISLSLWYIFNDPSVIRDISGNQPDITSTNNPNLYTSGQLTNYNANEGSLKLTKTQYITLQGSLPNWFRISNPAITILFHFKISASMSLNAIPIMCRFSGGVNIFYITMSLVSGSIQEFDITLSSTPFFVTLSPSNYIVADDQWHQCTIQIIYVYSNDGFFANIMVDTTKSGWWVPNVVPAYTDSSADTIYIGYDGITSIDYNWYIKDFGIYRGAFRNTPTSGCDIELGGISVWGPTASSPSTNTQTCLDCPSTSCMSINSGTKIATCSQTNSLPVCPSGSFLKTSTTIFCDDRCCPSPTSRTDCCDAKCSSCTGSSNTNCLSCNSGYYLDGTTCSTTCPAGTFQNPADNTCTLCSGCVTCSGSATTCTSCAAGYYLNSGTCSLCSGGCATCSGSAITCTTCSAGFYLNVNTCIACSGCATCTGSAANCLSCSSGYFLSGNTCVSTCPSGTFGNSADNTCIACSGCATCTGLATNCLSCSSGTFLNGNICDITCPPGTFTNSADNTCTACSGCATCQLSATACLSCSSGTFLNGNTCGSICPPGTFGNSADNACTACSGCATCTGSATNCLSCSSGTFLNGNICDVICPPGSFGNSADNTCTACSGCATCQLSATTCLSCSSGTFLNGNTCGSICPPGTFANSADNTCTTCIGCATCTGSATTCLSCPSGNFLNGNTCVLACPPGTYLDSGSNTCTPCNGCATCSGSATTCLSCSSGTFLNGNTCQTICPSGTFPNSISNTCSPCNGCATCQFSSTTCTSCPSGSFLYGNTCGSICPAGTYQDLVSNTCSPCSGCLTCTGSATFCTSCSSGMFLNGNTCSLTCPAGTYQNSIGNTCSPCSGCVTCQGSSITCTSCSPGLYLNGNTCITTCAAGTYQNTQDNACTPCSGCATCQGSATTCTSCSQGFYLNNQTQTCNTYTGGHLDVSQFDTRDIYLIFNFTLYSANIPNLNNALQLQISNLNTNDYTYNITQVSNTNITFRLSFNQTIKYNTLTVTIQDTTIIRDSNNQPVLTTINSVKLGVYPSSTSTITDLNDLLMITTIIIVIVGSMPMIISGGLGALWGVIDVLQYLFYFIYLNMNLPIEFEQFLIYFKIATIPLPNLPNFMFKSSNQDPIIILPKLDAPFKFMIFDIDALFLKNGLTYLVYSIAFIIVAYVVIGIERIFHKKTGSDRLKVVVNMVQWSFPLRYILVNIIQTSFAIFLQFTNFSTDGPIQNISNVFAIFSLISLLLFIIWAIKQTNSKLFKEDIEAFNLKYGSLTEEFVDSKSKDISFVTRNQCIIQIIRKIVFIFGFIILYYHVVVNLISIMIQSLIMIYLLKKYSPYLRISFNLKNIVEEIIFILMSLLLLLIYQDKIPAGDGTRIVGYILIILSCICFFYNVFFMIIDEIVGIKKILSQIKQYLQKLKRKNRRRPKKNINKVVPITSNSAYNKDNLFNSRNDTKILIEKDTIENILSSKSTNELLGNDNRLEILPNDNNNANINNNNNHIFTPTHTSINLNKIQNNNAIETMPDNNSNALLPNSPKPLVRLLDKDDFKDRDRDRDRDKVKVEEKVHENNKSISVDSLTSLINLVNKNKGKAVVEAIQDDKNTGTLLKIPTRLIQVANFEIEEEKNGNFSFGPPNNSIQFIEL